MLQARPGSGAQGRPARAVGLPHEIAARAVDGRRGPSPPGAVHRRRRVVLPSTSKTGRSLRRLVRVACARPRLTLLAAVVLAFVSIVYTISTLTFATSTRAL